MDKTVTNYRKNAKNQQKKIGQNLDRSRNKVTMENSCYMEQKPSQYFFNVIDLDKTSK